MSRHTLSVLVENKSGVLARVSALFSRRGFNIESLAVGPTENPDLSRMTIVVDVENQPLEQITKQLNKLIEVIKIVELDGAAAVQRELLLVKVRAPMAERTQVLQTAELFRARVVDVNPDTVTLEATGTPDKLQALLAVLAPLGIKEMAQSGTVALGRGPRSMSGAGTLRPVERSAWIALRTRFTRICWMAWRSARTGGRSGSIERARSMFESARVSREGWASSR